MAKNDIRSTRKMCESMADTVLDLFIEHMQDAAKRDQDIMLEPQELLVQRRSFRKEKEEKYLGLTQKIAEKWLSTIEKDYWDQSRKRPFERALVHRFSHLFPPTEPLYDDGAVSRRALPGIMISFEKLAGCEFIEQCQGAGRKIFTQVKENQGKSFTWDDYYNDPAISELVNDLMAIIAWSFRDANIRMKWMLGNINRHLAAPEDYAFEGDEVNTWTIREKAMVRMLIALLSDFKQKISHEESSKPLYTRYGDKACETIKTVIQQLDEANS